MRAIERSAAHSAVLQKFDQERRERDTLLADVLRWFDAVLDKSEHDGDEEGVHYLNGESIKYKSDAWEVAEELRRRLRKVVG